jgi:hypothetical protein
MRAALIIILFLLFTLGPLLALWIRAAVVKRRGTDKKAP